jgi:thiol:disulfide interchange protein DsbD
VPLFLAASLLSFGQNNVLSVASPAKVSAKAGSAVEAKLQVELRNGYHCNSDKPSDDYLIPLKLTWAPGVLQAGEVVYPKPQMEKYTFSEKPLSVYTGGFEIVTKFKAAAGAPAGLAMLTAKLRYQACTERMCLPPKTVDVSLPVEIVK